MEHIRKSLFGYHKKEVEDLVRKLEKDKELLKQELTGKLETIEQLNAQLYKYRS